MEKEEARYVCKGERSGGAGDASTHTHTHTLTGTQQRYPKTTRRADTMKSEWAVKILGHALKGESWAGIHFAPYSVMFPLRNLTCGASVRDKEHLVECGLASHLVCLITQRNELYRRVSSPYRRVSSPRPGAATGARRGGRGLS